MYLSTERSRTSIAGSGTLLTLKSSKQLENYRNQVKQTNWNNTNPILLMLADPPLCPQQNAMSLYTKVRQPEMKWMPTEVSTGPGLQCMRPELRPLYRHHARSIWRLPLLFSLSLQMVRTVGSSGALGHHRRVDTALHVKWEGQKHLEMPLLCQQQNAQSKENTKGPFPVKNIWKYIQLWYSFGVLHTPMVTSGKLTTLTALQETTVIVLNFCN